MPSRIVSNLVLRQALIVPVLGDFFPGSEQYEALVGPVRSAGLDVFGLICPFGVVSEGQIAANPEIYSISQPNERSAHQEMLVRTRTWLDLMGPVYRQIVVLIFRSGELASVWADAVQGPRRGNHLPVGAADRIVAIPIHRSTGLGGRILLTRLQNTLKR